ncbi:MAG TPA: hypothetical protein VFV19_17675 [Candidatus Polarisedimenticolaceae bacterium]|nr:hypothetical protein [Candidatus Polarisedimenticolaceae bacterium]
METIREALDRLARSGYVDEFSADGDGLRSRSTGTITPPESFRVDEIVRFEGESDPSDESVIFALRGDGTRGTYTVAYGTLMDGADAEMVRRLR